METSQGVEDKKQANLKQDGLFSVSLVLAFVGHLGYGVWISNKFF